MGFEAEAEATPLTPEQEARLQAIGLELASKELAEVGAAKSEEEVFYALPSAAMAAFCLNQLPQAEEFAERALHLAPQYLKNWNYGNAIHYGHIVLGLIALQSNDIPRAVQHLAATGSTPGSPQLNSFGPSMKLAKALLRTGESMAVLSYFEQCRKFWKMGKTWLSLWEQRVRDGGIPNFFIHAYR